MIAGGSKSETMFIGTVRGCDKQISSLGKYVRRMKQIRSRSDICKLMVFVRRQHPLGTTQLFVVDSE
jgi:hypothetical protein